MDYPQRNRIWTVEKGFATVWCSLLVWNRHGWKWSSALSKCGSLKEGWEEADSRHEDLSCGSDCHKGAPTSMLLKHPQRVSLPGNQVSSVNTIIVTLIQILTKGDCPRRRGLRPPHNVVDAAPHQAGGSLTCRLSGTTIRDTLIGVLRSL